MAETYVVSCWNCQNDFEAIEAVWCSCDPKHPSKLCPFCLSCFCPADAAYKRDFWDAAPQSLKDEVAILERSLDRLGEILIRNQKLKTPQLLAALREQESSGELLGKILIDNNCVSQPDIDNALKYQGYQPLVESEAFEVTTTPTDAVSNPNEILEKLLGLAARKGASDIHLDPTPKALSIKLRVDGLFYKIKPLTKTALVPMLTCIRKLFALDPEREDLPQQGRAQLDIDGHDYDLLVHALPTRHGASITIKLVDRRFFLKNFTALGLTPPEQLSLVQALDASAGLIMVTSPPYNGAMTSSYSLMDHIAKSERKVVSIERSIQWEVPYVHQMEINPDQGLDFAAALRSVSAVKPDVVFLFEINDEATANLACQLATTVLVITTFPAFGAAESGLPIPRARGPGGASFKRPVFRHESATRATHLSDVPGRRLGGGPGEARQLRHQLTRGQSAQDLSRPRLPELQSSRLPAAQEFVRAHRRQQSLSQKARAHLRRTQTSDESHSSLLYRAGRDKTLVRSPVGHSE